MSNRMAPPTPTPRPDSRPESADGVLAAARDRRKTADAAEAELLALGVEWALMHPADPGHDHHDGDAEGDDGGHEAATYTWRSWAGIEDTELTLAGDGAPTLAEFAVAEFATAIGLSPEAGKHYLGEALELCYRLPRLWARVQAGQLPAWKARRVARETIGLSVDAAAYVDRHTAPVAHKIGPAQLDRTVNEAIGRHMPAEVQRLAEASWDNRHVTIHDQLVSFTGTMALDAELDIADALDLEAALAAGAAQRAALGSTESLDVRRAQAVGDLARRQLALDLNPGTLNPDRAEGESSSAPRVKARQVVMYVHLSEAALHSGDACVDPVARLERGNSLVTVDQVRSWCGHPDAQVVVTPVIDLDRCRESDSDQVTGPIAEQVTLRDRTCVFPWCTRPARRCPHHLDHSDLTDGHPCDRDHVIPRARGGPTCTCNIAPLCRRHHRLKTHSPWTYVVLDPGTYLWTSPHGYQFLRDPDGTVDVSQDRPRLRPDGTIRSPEP